MSYLSPEQEDPEKRIRELERGLADTDHQAPQYPQVPNYGVSPDAGSTPAWTPNPVPSGFPGAPAFKPRRGWTRWVGFLGFVFPVVIAFALFIPWRELGVFDGLFGPEKVPQGGSLVVNASNKTKTIECNDGRLTLNGHNLQATVTGHCAHLFVNGYDHQVTVDSADSIEVNGMNTVVVYHSGKPSISTNGNVTVQQG